MYSPDEIERPWHRKKRGTVLLQDIIRGLFHVFQSVFWPNKKRHGYSDRMFYAFEKVEIGIDNVYCGTWIRRWRKSFVCKGTYRFTDYIGMFIEDFVYTLTGDVDGFTECCKRLGAYLLSWRCERCKATAKSNRIMHCHHHHAKDKRRKAYFRFFFGKPPRPGTDDRIKYERALIRWTWLVLALANISVNHVFNLRLYCVTCHGAQHPNLPQLFAHNSGVRTEPLPRIMTSER